MASLIAPMVAGVSTAASGTLEVFRAGTSTVAGVYSDSEGETQVTTHTLDARGAIVRYVEGRVDCVVKNVTGATVTSFTWGTDARDARVENLGFTGPDASAQTVAGGRTTVDAVLTDLFSSLGATDGMVSVNGAPQTLSAAISSSAGLVYNIKSGYGAVGDGVSDDSGPFQDMINAASTAGGGILYFPHGTYLLNSAVSVASGSGKFTYLGESATGTFIKQGTSGITMLALGASNNNLLLGITFTATASNTGTLVSVGSAGRATFLGCVFAALNGTQVNCAAATSSAAFLSCAISQAGALSRIGGGGASSMRFVGCDISMDEPGGSSFSDNSMILTFAGCTFALGPSGGNGGGTHISDGTSIAQYAGCRFVSTFTSGTAAIADSTGAGGAFSGCQFESTGGGALALGGGSTPVVESASLFVTTGVTIGGNTAEANRSQHRANRITSASGSATSYTPSGEYAIHEVISSGASMVFNDASPAVPTGQHLVILYKNTSAGNLTPTFGASYSFITAAAQVNINNSALYYFVPKFGTITTDLVQIAPQPVNGTTL